MAKLGLLVRLGSVLPLLISIVNCESTTPTVNTVNGTYAGKYLAAYDQDAFLGMAFALPPTGARRFQRPHYINESFTDIRNATTFGLAVRYSGK